MLVPTPDPWDPNTWVDDYEYRIYGTPDLNVFAIVDSIDYAYCAQWRWSVHVYKNKKKHYLRRGISSFYDCDGEMYESRVTGKLVRNRRRYQSNLFLHAAIVQRAGILPATPDHKIIDHIDRDTLNCRRQNLRWATHTENTLNRNDRDAQGRWQV